MTQLELATNAAIVLADKILADQGASHDSANAARDAAVAALRPVFGRSIGDAAGRVAAQHITSKIA